MSNEDYAGDSTPASVLPLRRVSGLWLIPIITLLVGFWLVYENFASQGPLITIAFHSADGLEEGKTKIKRHNIEVGYVVSISLDDNLNAVLVTARMHQGVGKYLVDDARFWVVQPTIGLSGISGLETLVSGQYIEFSPGSSVNRSDSFEALDSPPLTPPGTPGLHVTLNSVDNFNYTEGDPILYKGFKVGKVEDVYFNSSERMMYYNAFIESPFHELLTTNTRFWDVSGIRTEVTSEGFAVHTSSLESILIGGISFGLPEGEPYGKPVSERAFYLIYPDRVASEEKHYVQAISFILLVDDNVSGLQVGAPVMMRGIQVGKVVRTGYIPENGSLLDRRLQIPIHIDIHPGRLGLPDTEQGKTRAQVALEKWLDQGMNASMKIHNLLLGQQLVELNFPNTLVETTIVLFEGMIVIPVNQGGIGEIADTVAALLKNINEVQFSDIGNNLEQLLIETTATMQQLRGLASSGESILIDAHQQSLIKGLNDTLEEVRVLASSYGTESSTNRNLRQLLEGMSDVLSDLKPLLAELNSKPNGLIFTGRQATEPEPEEK